MVGANVTVLVDCISGLFGSAHTTSPKFDQNLSVNDDKKSKINYFYQDC